MIKLIVKTNTNKYPILIGNSLIKNLSLLLKNNSITFNKCMIVIDKKVPKKFKKDLNNWISILTTWDFENNNPDKPLRPTVTRFINSNNQIKKIK